MTRPQLSEEKSAQNKWNWYAEQARIARQKHGDRGAMDSWIAIVRNLIKRDTTNVSDVERKEVFAGFTLVIRLFMLALERRAAGDRGLWQAFLGWAKKILDAEAERLKAEAEHHRT